MATFLYEGHRLDYTIHGHGERTTVLLPGLLLPQTMHFPLARQLAARGNRVVTLDPLGHGASDRPEEMWHYSMSSFAHQTVALLDHLEVERAIVGGTSLGANITLEVASLAASRLQGMVVEMPVLDSAIPACGVAFTPMLLMLKLGRRPMAALARGAGAVPRQRMPLLAQVGLDWVSQEPGPSAAVLGGILYGRVAPDHAERMTFDIPALVIGHPRDPVHPFSDAGMLVSELPNGRLLHASSILELRLRPRRLTGLIADFIDECWEAPEQVSERPVQRPRSAA
jgi:pimeloyl-ACP methyl ester carboxylesterase